MNLATNGNDKTASDLTGNEWSVWLDLDQETVTSLVPEVPGLFKVHAGMKILYIGSTQNLKKSLLDSLTDSCISKGKRFSYMVSQGSLENLKMELLNDYRLRHNGYLPACMENS